MQKAKNENVTASAVDADAKWVILFMNGVLYTTTGNWRWPLQSSAVFCSDVMAGWPDGFTGTKSILHPDDKDAVAAALEKLLGSGPTDFCFRIITTYGEIKWIEGAGIHLAEPETPSVFQPETALLAQTQRTQALPQMIADLSLQKAVFGYAERLNHQGVWQINRNTGKTWFSDGMFRLLGLPPQSINVHSNTLYAFVHSEDHQTVVKTVEEALEKSVPLHLWFRLVQADGVEKWVEQTMTWDFTEGGESLVYGLLQDVSAKLEEERKREAYETALSLQNGLLHFAENATGIGYWQINVLTRKVIYSDNYYRLFGLKPNMHPAGGGIFSNFIHPDDRELYDEVQRKIRKEHTVPEIDYRILRPDGKLRYLRQKGKALISGNEILMAGTIQDITVQKTLEKKLSSLQQNLEVKTVTVHQAEEMAGTGSWLWNLKTGETDWSQNFYEVLGQKQSAVTITQKLLLRSIHADDQKLFADGMEITLKEKQPANFSFRIIRLGEVRHLKAAFRLFSYREDEIFIATVQDVTAEEEALQSLTGRMRLVEQLADTIPDQVMITDADNNILLWNKKAEEVYKWKREKAIGQNFFDVLSPLKQELLMNRLANVMGGEEIRVYDEPGRFLLRGYFDTMHIPLRTAGSGVSGILHLIRDVTPQHNLHEQLSSRLQFIERLLEVSLDRIVALDRNMNYLYWNRKAEEDFGLKKEDVIGKNILEIFPGRRQQLLYADFRKALYGETVFHPATEEAKEESYLVPVKDDKEEVTAVLWVQHDRSNDLLLKKQSQKALDIINSLNENYLELDNEYRIVFVNRQTLKYFGKAEGDVLEKRLWDLYPQMVDTSLHIALMHAMEERTTVRNEFMSPVHDVHLLVSIAPTVDGIAVAFSDIQFIKEAEKKLAEEHRRLNEAQAIGHVGSFEWTVGTDVSQWSDELYRINGLAPQSEVITLAKVHGFIYTDDRAGFEKEKAASLATAGRYSYIHRIVRKETDVRWLKHQWESVADENGKVVKVRGVVQDITEQRKAEEELLQLKDELAQRVTNKYQTIINSLDQGFCIIEAIFRENRCVDWRYLDANPVFKKQSGFEDAVGKTINGLLPGVETFWKEVYGKVALTGESIRVEDHVKTLDKWFDVYAFRIDEPEDRHVAVLFNDVTSRKKAAQRQAYLLKLSDALRPLADPVDIQQTVTQTAMDHFAADRCYYNEIENGNAIIRRDAFRGDLPSIAGVYPLDNFAIYKALIEAGQPVCRS